jgi:pimeloyl-ACP methyl ester carboxylesterase
MEHQYIRTNGITLHVVVAGDPNGEPILLLHGFPEFWGGWKKQIPYLVEKGYRVIVPDQRGYNLSDKPNRVEDYLIDVLAADAVGLMEALGYDRFHLVGHDWGAAVAWWTARTYYDRLKSLTILNVPYPTVMLKEMRKGNWQQLMKSWYIGFFQIPFLPEVALGAFNAQGLANAMKASSNPTTFSDDDLASYREAWLKPDAIRGMLSWYRALIRTDAKAAEARVRRDDLPKGKYISTPTQILWGEKDIALSKTTVPPSADICTDVRVEYFPNATHWLQHDEPDAVNERIHQHVSAHV